MKPKLSQQVVLVTGGAKGIGAGISQEFLAHGATVICCGRQQPDQLPQSQLYSDPQHLRQAEFIHCDVLELDQIQQLISTIKQQYGRLDVLINNAGGAPFAAAATASPRFSEKIIKLNLLAPLNLSQAANTLMQQQANGGCIINIASVSALRPSPGTAAYGAAKAGLVSLTQSLAVEWAPKVRVNAIAAGLVRTQNSHLHYGDEQGIEAVGKTIPLQRMAEPKDVANSCIYLASDYASYVTGSCVSVHGGGERPAFLDAANSRDQQD